MMKNTKLSILLSKRDVTAPIPDDLAEWLDSPSVGNEIITDCEDTPLSSDDEYRAALKKLKNCLMQYLIPLKVLSSKNGFH